MNQSHNSIEESALINFQDIFDVLPGNHLLIKADPPRFTILTACQNYLSMVGRSLDKLVGLGVFEAFPPNPDNEDIIATAILLKSFNEVIITKKQHLLPVYQYDLEVGEPEKYIQKFWQVKNSPVTNENGHVTYIINTVEDITEKILLQRSKEELQPLQQSHNLYKQAPIGIGIYRGPELIISLANNMLMEIWAKDNSVIGKSFSEVFPELKKDGYEQMMHEVMEKGIPKTFYEWPVAFFRNGKLETNYYNWSFQPYYEDNESKAVGILVFTNEVTTHVKAKQVMEENRLLELKNKELEQFAYIASHDLQEPLRKVSFFIQMLQDNLDHTNDNIELYIEKILSATGRMSQLIQDILGFSRMSVTNEKFSKCNLDKILKQVIADFEISISENKAVIEYGKMPVIMGIELHLHQLFHNLVSNALKFKKSNEVPVIKISSSKVNARDLKGLHDELAKDMDYHYIVVSDNGIGFNQEYAERIFGIFQRLHGKMKIQGTGIGLALCRKIVENQNGKIWATSAEGEGTKMHILLPSI